MKRITLALALSSCALLLAGCGGGSSSSSEGTSPPPVQVPPPVVTPPTTTPGDLQTSVGAATYPSGSEELAFYSALNDFRAKMGLGLLAQSAALDTANKNHLQYLLKNTDIKIGEVNPQTGVPYAHEEESTRPGFTGVTPMDRAKFAGYAATYSGEQVTYGLGKGSAFSLPSLIASVYHRQGLMLQSAPDFGISVGGDTYQTTVFTFGIASKRQRNASDFFGFYPADKQTDVGLSTYPEVPNPYPGLTANDFATKTSFPINVVVEESMTLTVDTFTVTEAGQSVPLDAWLLTAATDPNKLLAKNTAYLVGKSAFKPSTVYNVSFKGAVSGAAVSKAWSFTTTK